MVNNHYSLKVTPAARDDLKAIYQYISENLYNEPATERYAPSI